VRAEWKGELAVLGERACIHAFTLYAFIIEYAVVRPIDRETAHRSILTYVPPTHIKHV